MTYTTSSEKPATIYHRYHEAAYVSRHLNDDNTTLDDGTFVSIRPVTDGFIIEIFNDEGYQMGVL